MTLKTVLLGTGFGLFVATGAMADDVTDTLQSALKAYEDGDVTYALEELDYAKQLLQEMQTGALADFLPAAPEGWTAEEDTDTVAGFAMMGGGTAAAQSYTNETGDSFTISIVVDSPMIAMMGGMISNAGAMGMKTVRVGREKFLENEGDLTALVEGRVLVQASGEPRDVVLPLLESIDYRALGRFGY
ncbi:hypothetical protein [Celeribacter sp. HF31]|uniref:hypothetical protein n=1 Tax=Celeribacter sp. HF31 TaxID=2721558 RepID=UPI0020CA2B98|nr:hypothetical protein [Celeribacter sp. HF31]